MATRQHETAMQQPTMTKAEPTHQQQTQQVQQPDENDSDWESLFQLILPGNNKTCTSPLFAHQVASPEWAMPFLNEEQTAPEPVFHITHSPMWRTKLTIENPNAGTCEELKAAVSEISDSIALPLGDQEATVDVAVFHQWVVEDGAMAASPHGDHFSGLLSTRKTRVQSDNKDKNSNNSTKLLEDQVWKIDVTKPAGAALFSRMQSLAVWYIETASMVDADDDRWTPLALFCETESGERVLGGFCSLYQFTNPINETQPHSLRVCQFLVLPHLRREVPTRAQHLLQTVYDLAAARSDVSQVTAESPNHAFTRLRDVVDCTRILALEASVSSGLVAALSVYANGDKGSGGTVATGTVMAGSTALSTAVPGAGALETIAVPTSSGVEGAVSPMQTAEVTATTAAPTVAATVATAATAVTTAATTASTPCAVPETTSAVEPEGNATATVPAATESSAAPISSKDSKESSSITQSLPGGADQQVSPAESGVSTGNIHTPIEILSIDVVKPICERLKMTKRQVRRCYDILRLEALQRRANGDAGSTTETGSMLPNNAAVADTVVAAESAIINNCTTNEYKRDLKKFRLGVKRKLYHECAEDLAACGEDKEAMKEALASLYNEVERGYTYAVKRARMSMMPQE